MGVAIIVPGVSFADANLGKVNISGDVPVQALRIVAEDSYFGTSAQLSVSYIPVATTQREVTWSIEEGSEFANISNTGLLVIKDGAKASQVRVKVTSANNTNIYATKQLSVTYKGGDIPVGAALMNDGNSYLKATEFCGSQPFGPGGGIFEIEFAVTAQSSKQRSIFGASTSQYMTHLLSVKDSLNLRIDDCGSATNPLFTYQIDSKIIYRREASSITIKMGDTERTYTAGLRSINSDFALFAIYTATSYNNVSEYIKIFSAKYIGPTGETAFDLVPSLNNGVPTMYDKVSGQHLTPMNGSFSIV